MNRVLLTLATVGALVSLAGLACIVVVGHTAPGSVFWTAAGLVSLIAIPGGAAVWGVATFAASLTKKDSSNAN